MTELRLMHEASDRYRQLVRRRFSVANAIAAVIVLALFSLIPYPDFSGFQLLRPSHIDVDIMQPEDRVAELEEAEPEAAEQPEDDTTPESDSDTLDEPETQVAEDESSGDPEPNQTLAPEWYSELDKFVENADLFADEPASMDPTLDERRRIAAARYSKPDSRMPKKIWENTEIDQMGRTILRHGDCWRVLNDPAATRQWEFENFGQYIVNCTYQKKLPQMLPWVDEIVAKYPHLQNDKWKWENERDPLPSYPSGMVPPEEND